MGNNNIHQSELDFAENLKNLKLVEISFHEKYNVFDIQLMNVEFLSTYDFVELDISFFPLSRNITSENYEFEPFEHYIDETKNNISMYRQQQDIWEHISWFWTSALLTGVVAEFNPQNITETESLVALVASYIAGMRARPTIESFFINKSAKRKLQFKERYYQYLQNIASTGEKYDNHAKKMRYKMENIRPDQIWIVIDSIRQKMRLRFTKKQLLWLPSDTEKANVMNISIPENLRQEFFSKWVQIWVHMKLWNKLHYFPIMNTRTELIQTLLCMDNNINNPKIWCIDRENQWFQNWFMEHRETIGVNRLKYYKRFDIDKGNIVDFKYKPQNSTMQLTPEVTLADGL